MGATRKKAATAPAVPLAITQVASRSARVYTNPDVKRAAILVSRVYAQLFRLGLPGSKEQPGKLFGLSIMHAAYDSLIPPFEDDAAMLNVDLDWTTGGSALVKYHHGSKTEGKKTVILSTWEIDEITFSWIYSLTDTGLTLVLEDWLVKKILDYKPAPIGTNDVEKAAIIEEVEARIK